MSGPIISGFVSAYSHPGRDGRVNDVPRAAVAQGARPCLSKTMESRDHVWWANSQEMATRSAPLNLSSFSIVILPLLVLTDWIRSNLNQDKKKKKKTGLFN